MYNSFVLEAEKWHTFCHGNQIKYLHVYQLCQNCVGQFQYRLSGMPPFFRAPTYRKPILKPIHTLKKNPHPQKKMNWLSTPRRLILWL